MADLFSLLTQSQPKITTGQALLVVDMQNDFILPDGKLPIPDADDNFVNKVGKLAENFCGKGEVIWVRSVFKTGRTVNDASGCGDRVIIDTPGKRSKTSSSTATLRQDGPETSKVSSPLSHIESRMLQRPSGARVLGALKRAKASNGLDEQEGILTKRVNVPTEFSHDTDPELFLSENAAQRTGGVELNGSEFVDRVRDNFQRSKDIKIVKSHYSAFTETALLLTLRAKFITQLYICGCFANLSIYATVVDAVRHGFDIQLIEDCLVSRSQSRHREAKRQIVDLLGATTVLSDSLMGISTEVQSPDAKGSASDLKDEPQVDCKDESVNTEEIQRLMQKIDLRERHDGIIIPSHENKEIDPNMASTSYGKDKEREEQRMLSDLAFPRNHSEHERNSHESKTKIDKRPLSIADHQRDIQAEVIGKNESYTQAAIDQKENMNTKPVTAEFEKGSSELAEPVTSDSTGVSDKIQTDYVNESPKSNTTVESETVQKNSTVLQAHSSSQIPDKVANPTQKANMSNRVLKESFNEKIGEGDSSILFDLIPSTIRDPTEPTKTLSNTVFSRLYHEVQWQKMFHVQGEVPRLVAVQGEIREDGSMPVYRHPSDQSPPLLHFSPTVQLIRDVLQKRIDQPVNHVLIQLYRSGNDYISEHSDKTLDIVRGSSILNVSFGAQRTMRLRTKKPLKEEQTEETRLDRITQRVPMPHNSMFVLGQKTNAYWLHSITQDKRAPRDRTEAEKAYEGSRISLTFRHVGTFLDSSGEHIWGQGATSKLCERRNKVVNGNEGLAQEMIYAFGTENRSSIFDWKGTYGAGFDVLHFYTNPPHFSMLFLSGNSLDDLAALICLKELKLSFETIDPPTMTTASTSSWPISEPIVTQDHIPVRNVCYRDNDVGHTEVVGAHTILLYLDRYHHLYEVVSSYNKNDNNTPRTFSRSCTARAYAYLSTPKDHSKEIFGNNLSPLLTASDFFDNKNNRNSNKNNNDEEEEEEGKNAEEPRNRQVLHFLQAWEYEMKDCRSFAAGSSFTIADCLLWPRLHYLLYQREGGPERNENKEEEEGSRVKEYPLLSAYHDRLAERESIKGIVKEEETVVVAAAATTIENSAT